MGVTVEYRDTTAIVTLDWPERRNVLGPPEGRQLNAALTAVSESADTLVVVLTGNGAFCAGGDLPALTKLVAEGGADAVRETLYGIFHGVIRSLVGMPVPVIAALDGPAMGLGMDLALACDVRVMGPKAWLRHGWGELGLIPGTGGELLLRRLAPSLTWSLLGGTEQIGSQQAERLGLAQAAGENALTEALRRAATLASVSPDALRGYVRLHRAELREKLDRHLESCLELQAQLLCSEEFRLRAERVMEGIGRRIRRSG